jgi:hypothetical protein
MPDKQWSRAGREPPHPCTQAATLPKELSRQLISWLFGTSTWPEAGAAFGPLHGRPSACGVTHGLKLGSRPNSPCKCSKPEPLAGPRVSNHVRVTTIEKLDQGHLYPLGERHAGQTMVTNLRYPAPQVATLPKKLSRQLLSWLFGSSTWPEAGAAFGPLHGRPSACGVTHGLKLGSRPNSPCKCGKPEPLASLRVLNHVRVTTIEKLDQGHLYPLGERHAGQTMVTNLRTPAPQAATLPKELSRQLISWLFGTSTWPEAGAAFGPLQ